jgi:nitrogen fixation-related uncharacterized protein
MKHVHSLRFDTLETRQLLSTAHAAVAHTAHATRAAAVPLVLNGTLTVDNNPALTSITTNVDGSMTTSVPVAGQLGTLGQVHGVWNETVDQFGDYDGPDTLVLRDAKRSFGVAFDNQNGKPSHAKTRGAIVYEHAQTVLGGNGAYARAKESGSIELTTNAARTQVVSLTLLTKIT